MPTRNDALGLLHEYTKGEGLRKHALAVEAVMRALARRYGEDEETWGIVGLLHDFDYERWPDRNDHPFRGAEILRAAAFPEFVVRAILGHADYTGVPRDTLCARALYATDELVGFVTAVALVRPGKSLAEVEVPAVLKKMKDKGFARSVPRDDLLRGAAELGVPFEEHVGFVVASMREVAETIGLAGREPGRDPAAGEVTPTPAAP